MAKKKDTTVEVGERQIVPDKGIEILNRQIQKADELLSARPLSKESYSAWELLTSNFLEKTFGTNSPNISSVMDVGKYGGFPMGAGEEYWERHRSESLNAQILKIKSLIELLETEIDLFGEPAQAKKSQQTPGHSIFLVHGHNEAILHKSARFLEKLDQDVRILRELPNRGRTIIEKFEDFSDVGFAVILLTADDRAGTIDCSFDDQKTRARQNVVLELGYFIGKIGRSRVCALYQEGVEIPSDYSGVIFIQLDQEGAWRFSLAKELKAAGFDIDMNKAL